MYNYITTATLQQPHQSHIAKAKLKLEIIKIFLRDKLNYTSIFNRY